MSAWFYILRLQSGALYLGATTDVRRRYDEHCRGIACETTKRDRPVALVYSEECPVFADARRREAQVKRWSYAKKEALVTRDKSMLHALVRRRKR